MFRRLDFVCMPFLLAWLVVFLVRGLCSLYLAFCSSNGYSFICIDPVSIFAPFEGSSSSYSHHVEGFFLELLLCMPALSQGVLCRGLCILSVLRPMSVRRRLSPC